MFENIINFFKNIGKKEDKKQSQESSKDAAKERLHLVLMQDRANVSADFLELMKQEIIDVKKNAFKTPVRKEKKYIEIDEKEIDVRLTNKENEDGTNGAPALYANIPILNIKNDARKINKKDVETKKENKKEEVIQEKEEIKQEEKVEKIDKNEEETNKNKEEKTTVESENETLEEQNEIKQESNEEQEEETEKEEVKSEN